MLRLLKLSISRISSLDLPASHLTPYGILWILINILHWLWQKILVDLLISTNMTRLPFWMWQLKLCVPISISPRTIFVLISSPCFLIKTTRKFLIPSRKLTRRLQYLLLGTVPCFGLLLLLVPTPHPECRMLYVSTVAFLAIHPLVVFGGCAKPPIVVLLRTRTRGRPLLVDLDHNKEYL